jgi:hypothetical protein
METNQRKEKIEKISMDQIISSIQEVRNQQINELMKESILESFLEQHYDVIALSNVKKEFLLRDLAELKTSSLDLAHYSSLITRMKEAKNVTVDGKSPHFQSELKSIFEKYISKK